MEAVASSWRVATAAASALQRSQHTSRNKSTILLNSTPRCSVIFSPLTVAHCIAVVRPLCSTVAQRLPSLFGNFQRPNLSRIPCSTRLGCSRINPMSSELAFSPFVFLGYRHVPCCPPNSPPPIFAHSPSNSQILTDAGVAPTRQVRPPMHCSL